MQQVCESLHEKVHRWLYECWNGFASGCCVRLHHAITGSRRVSVEPTPETLA